jgi:subtilisin family serine protease
MVGGASLVLVACGGSDDPTNPLPDERKNAIQLVSVSEIESSQQCAYGGHEIKAGLDLNSNGELDAAEVLSTRFVCDEPPAEIPDPLLAVGASYELLEDQPKTGQLTFENGEGNVSFTVGLEPLNGSVEIGVNGEFTYIPNTNFNGQDVFSFVVESNTGERDEGIIELTVENQNDAPEAGQNDFTVIQGNTLRHNLIANDVDNDSLEFALISNGELGSATISTSGELVYLASQVLTGSDTVQFSVTDGVSTITAAVSIEVLVSGDGVATSPASFVVQEDTVHTGQLTSENGTGDIQYSVLMPAINGELAVNADGSFTYTPVTGFSGQDLFSFYAVDDFGPSNISQVSIVVTERNRAPIAVAMSVDTFSLNAVSVQLEAFDVNGDDLVYSLNDDSALAEVTLSETGLFSYTPNQPYTGLDSLTYSVTDGEFTSEAQISVSVTESAIRFESPLHELQAQLEQRQTLEGTIRLANLSSEAISLTQLSLPFWYTSEQQFEVPANGEYELAYTLSAMSTSVATYTDYIYFMTNEAGSSQLDYSLNLEVTADVTPPAMISDLALEPGNLYDEVTLSWTAVGDSGNAGGAARVYDIRMSAAQITEANWDEATPVAINRIPLQPGVSEQLRLDGLDANTNYYFAVRAEDHASLLGSISNVVTHTTPQLPVPELAPASAAVELQEGESEVVNITLTNTGGSPLEFNTRVQVNEPLPALPIPTNVMAFSPAKRVMPAINSKAIAASTGNIIVKMNPGVASMRMFGSTLSSMQLKTESSFDKLGLSIVSAPNKSNDEVADLVNQLNGLPEVAYAEPDYLVSINALPDDAMFDQQWALNNEGQTGGDVDADIDAPESWDRYTNGSNVVVAVIDTGVKYDHEDLANNMWVNEGEIPGNGVDDDENGFIDDVYGYDFVNNDGDPMDDNQHGTHCAGIIGADTNNGVGIAGTAHNAQIMAVKFLSASGSGGTSAAIQSVLYAVDNGATILSNSWGGGGFSQALMDAIQYAHDNDVMFIAAAGNSSRNTDASPNYPSGYDVANVLSVASTTHIDSRSSFSNYGATTVDLGAPGSDILSTIHTGGYASLSGTSMATPYVSGAAVLIRSNFPHLSAQDVKEILMSTVDPIPALEGLTVTGGRLNVEAALNEASSNGFIIVSENASGVIEAGGSITVPVSINALGKAGGLYENTITFNTNNPEQSALVFDLDVTVVPDEVPPAAPSDLNVQEVTSSTITLEWTNTGDDGLDGQAQSIIVAYSDQPITEENWQSATLLEVSAGISGELQQLVVANLLPASQYFFAMKTVDNMGLESGLSNNADVTTLLGPVISLTPESIPVVELAPGELATETLEIANTGDETLTYSLIYEPVDAIENQAKLNTEDKSLNLIKGEKDYRQGEPAALASGGPDVFGYRWGDSDGNSVIYDWTDITATGTAMSFSDDSVTSAIDLGFTFEFYGVEYTQIRVSSNGFLTFSDSPTSGCCTGQPIPSVDSNNNLIAWAWRDLHPKEGSGHYLIEADKVTFQFTDFGEFSGGGGTITAQVIIYENGIIKLQYHSFTETFRSNEVSIGIENTDGSDGLQVAFNSEYLHGELAVAFSTLPSWLTLGQSGGSIEAGADNDVVNFNYDATGLLDGTYEANILVESNDLTTPVITIPLRLDVVTPVL